MEAYEGGEHAYHATMPTDAIVKFHQSMTETDTYGLDKVRDEQQELGDKVRALMASYGFKSLAADGYGARAWWFVTPTIPIYIMAANLPRLVFRPPPATC